MRSIKIHNPADNTVASFGAVSRAATLLFFAALELLCMMIKKIK